MDNAGTRWEGSAGLLHLLFAGLVPRPHQNHRCRPHHRRWYHLQHVLARSGADELGVGTCGVDARYALLQPGLDPLPFFSGSERTVYGADGVHYLPLRQSVPPAVAASSQLRPSGGWEQAMATKWASLSPSSFLGRRFDLRPAAQSSLYSLLDTAAAHPFHRGTAYLQGPG